MLKICHKGVIVLSIFRPSLAVTLLIPSVMALMPIMVLLWWLGSVELEDQLAQKKADLQVKSVELNERFAYQIRQAEIALQTLAQSPILRTLEHNSCQERVEQHFKVLNQNLANLLVLNPQGQVVCNAKDPSKLHNLSERAYFKRAVETGKFAVGDFNIGKTTGTHIIGMAYPVIVDQKLTMLTATSLELNMIVASFNKVLQGSDFELTMLDTNGVVLSHWQKSGQFVPPGTPVANHPLAQHMMNPVRDQLFEMADLLGNESYFAQQPLTYNGQVFGHLALSYHKTDLFQVSDQQRHYQLAAIMLLFIVGMGIAGFMMNRLLSQRLKPMMQAVEAIGQGKLGVQLPIGKVSDELTKFAKLLNDMSVKLVKQQDHLVHVAYYDLLTGVHNKYYLQEILQQNMDSADDRHLDLLLLDLDNFRLINDSLGHDKGDELLIQIAKALDSLSSERSEFAHMGADEFAFLMINGDASEIQHHLEAVYQCFNQPFIVDANALTVSVSIGIASYPEDAGNAVALFQHADAALNKSKQDGKNTHSFYSAQMKESMAQRLMFENGLRQALTRSDELVLFYQPQVNQNGKVRHFEALIRWHHPKLGMVSPQAFIPIAEESTLIVQLGNWVLNQACQQMRHWLDQGYQVDYVAVNISAKQLYIGDLVAQVEQAVRQAGIQPHQLELEITEGFIIKDPEHAIEVLTQLKLLGVRLAMDDFGTGYSSLLYLKRLPLDALKVDQGFVRDMLDDPHDAAIVQAVISLGHNFGLSVVAEGVETKAQADNLRFQGCELLQGYLFSKPVSSKEAEAWLEYAS